MILKFVLGTEAVLMSIVMTFVEHVYGVDFNPTGPAGFVTVVAVDMPDQCAVLWKLHFKCNLLQLQVAEKSIKLLLKLLSITRVI